MSTPVSPLAEDPLTRLGRLLDVSNDAIVSAGPDQRIVLFNQGAERMFGYTSAEVVGKPLDVLLPGRFRPAHHRQVVEFAHGTAAARLMGERNTVFGVRKDGTEFPAEVTISRYHDDGLTYVNAIVRDVTERKRIEQHILALNQELEARVKARTAELEETNRQLARTSEENEAFVQGVSHDLRSPLVNLEGFSRELAMACGDLRDMLQTPGLPVEVRDRAAALVDHDIGESIGYIQTAVTRLSGIIDALLRLSRAGRVEYRPQSADVTAAANRVVSALHGSILAAGAEVTVDSLPPAWADPLVVEQAFANLIGNAVKYLAPGRSGRVRVWALDGVSAGERVYFVDDNGRGIPSAYAALVFQPFHRLAPEAAPGEGMGLALTRRMLARQGGRVWFEPNPEGTGTRFAIALPASPLAHPPEGAGL